MDNLQAIIEPAVKKKGVSVRQMCKDIDITEQGYYRAIKANSMRMSTYNRIADYLGIETNTNQKVSVLSSKESNVDTAIDWKGLIDELSKEIGELKMENWLLKKELGKCDTVHLAISAA